MSAYDCFKHGSGSGAGLRQGESVVQVLAGDVHDGFRGLQRRTVPRKQLLAGLPVARSGIPPGTGFHDAGEVLEIHAQPLCDLHRFGK